MLDSPSNKIKSLFLFLEQTMQRTQPDNIQCKAQSSSSGLEEEKRKLEYIYNEKEGIMHLLKLNLIINYALR